MEIISFEKRTFEEIAAKLDHFVKRVESLCRERGLPQVAYQPEDLADPEG